METEARVRKLTSAFLDAQRERAVEALSGRLTEAGAADRLPTHRALFDLARAHVRRPSRRGVATGVRKTFAGVSRQDIPALISGQIALWTILHRMFREVEGPHKEMEVTHEALALAGDAVDGVIGALIDLAHTENGPAPGWGTLVEVGRMHRECRALLDAIPDMMIRHSRDGVYLDFKPAKGFDPLAPPSEFLGKRVHEVLPAEVAQQAMRHIEQAIRTGDVQVFEYQLPTHGEMRDFEARVVVCGEDVLGIVRDITERRQLAEQLREAHKMEAVGRLAGGIAHDFNNLLQVVTGQCELLLVQHGEDRSVTQGIEEIKKAGERAAILTRQLLAFSRQQALSPKVLDLNGVVSGVSAMLRRVIGEDIALNTRLGPDLWPVRVDPVQVEQVILNLAVNARDAMPQGGTLILSTRNIDVDDAYVREHPLVRPGPFVALTVSDTGHGMDEETMARAFDPFFTTKGVGKGTGLGLAMAYGTVQQSGGSIEVASKPGDGASFTIYLPRIEAPPAAASDVPSSASLGGDETVLVVEDESPVRDLICRVLRGKGYTVIGASDGEDALRVAGERAGPIHLVVTDVVMPKMGGVELAERLTSLRPGAKVLFISGYLDNDHRIAAGAFCLTKPFTPDALSRRVREALQRPAEGR